MPLDPDEVAEVQELHDLEVERWNRVLANVRLNGLETVRQDQKVRLPERANAENAAAGRRRDLLGLELVVRALAVRLDEGADAVRPLESSRVDIDAELRELVE